MSAEIIQFIPKRREAGERTDFPTIVFRSVLPDPDVDRIDTAPSEYLPSDWEEK